MESQQISLKIPCPIHNQEFVQRVHIEVGVNQQLYCLECILSADDFSLNSKLKTIVDLIDTVANFDSRMKQSPGLRSKPSTEHFELISGHAEN